MVRMFNATSNLSSTMIHRITPTKRLQNDLDRLVDETWYQEQINKHQIKSIYQKRVFALLALKQAAKMRLIFDVSSFCADKNVQNALVWMRDRSGLFEQIPGTSTVKYIG